jgi:hypothetical protein
MRPAIEDIKFQRSKSWQDYELRRMGETPMLRRLLNPDS